MNWSAISFDWNHVRAFLATAEEGSLSAAARALGQTQPTLGRQISALEDTLDIALFERIGKRLVLTPSGAELLPHVRAMAEAAEHLSLTAAGKNEKVEGSVRLTASDIYAARLLPAFVGQLSQAAPGIQLEIIAANDIRDIQRREADIAIRHVRPEQPELIARRIREDTAHLYAAPDYLRQHGTPQHLEDLHHHKILTSASADDTKGFLDRSNIAIPLESFRHLSDSGIVMWELARAGQGMSIMSDLVAARTPEMIRLTALMDPIRFPLWLTTHRELHTSRRFRVVFDLLAEFLKNA